VAILAGATGPGTIYYRFLYKAGYGTPEDWSANPWIRVQDFSINNTASFAFPSEDNYCVIVQASDDPSVWGAGDPQGGLTIEVKKLAQHPF
jgi:hypothetical protein